MLSFPPQQILFTLGDFIHWHIYDCGNKADKIWSQSGGSLIDEATSELDCCHCQGDILCICNCLLIISNDVLKFIFRKNSES